MRDALVESHPAFAAGASEVGWLANLRREALARFDAVGLPTAREESWRYTSLRPLLDTAFTHRARVAAADLGALDTHLAPYRLPFAAAEIVVVDGQVSPELSRFPRVAGLEVEALAGAWSASGIEDRFGRLAPWQEASFVALNTALVQDGLRIRATAEVPDPVHVIVVGRAGPGAVAAHLRTLVDVERHARLEVVETHVETEATSLTTHVVEAKVGPGAALGWGVVGAHGDHAHLVHVLGARVEADATLRTHGAWVGGAITRSELHVVLGAAGARADLDGLYVLGGRRHTDVHTVVDHVAPRATSRESYKAVLGGSARAVFDGTVHVRPGADGTDAAQDCRTMLVSADAEMNAKPTLVIEADDVRCAHGTAIGQLDREQLGYLTSRGIPRDVAKALLTRAFVADRVAAIPDERVRAHVEALVEARLSGLVEAL